MNIIWEYALVETTKGQKQYFGIYETYYRQSDNDGASYTFCGYTKESIFGEFESICQLAGYLVALLKQDDLGGFPGNQEDAMKMLAAMNEGILKYEDFPTGKSQLVATTPDPDCPMMEVIMVDVS